MGNWRLKHGAVVYNVYFLYWPIVLWSIDTCQIKASTDQYNMATLWAQVYNSLRSYVVLSF